MSVVVSDGTGCFCVCKCTLRRFERTAPTSSELWEIVVASRLSYKSSKALHNIIVNAPCTSAFTVHGP